MNDEINDDAVGIGDDDTLDLDVLESRATGTARLAPPGNLRATATTQTSVEVAWDAPSDGKANNYLLYLNWRRAGSTKQREFEYTKLSCGKSYTLTAIALDTKGNISERAEIQAATAKCGDSIAPSAPSTPNAPSTPSTPSTPNTPSTPSAPATGYAAAVLADKPVAYWRLDEASGMTTASDRVGGHDGRYKNGVGLGAQGAVDKAASFDGVDDSLSVPDASELRLNGSFSIEFWARGNADKTSWPGILAKGSAKSDATGYVVYYAPNEKRPSFKRAGVDGLHTSDAGKLASDRFQHYVFTYDAGSSTARWYVAGAPDASYNSISFPANMDTSAFELGRGDVEGGAIQYANVVLDEAAVYSSALSEERVRAHFAASGLSTTPTTPVEPAPSAPVATSGFPIGITAYNLEDLPRIAAMGMKHVRWDRPSADVIERARGYGIEILPIACYSWADLNGVGVEKAPPLPQNRVAWAKRMIDLWRGMKNPPKVIEVWNEPWLSGFWNGRPQPAVYLELVKVFADEAWKVWPNVILLVSADEGQKDVYPNFRRDLIAADTTGILKDRRILPTTHNYVQAQSPTQKTPQHCSWDLTRFDCAYDDFKKHGHPDPKVWITEFGWESNTPAPSYSTFGAVSEQQMADYTIESLEIFRKSGKVAAAYAYMYHSGSNWSYAYTRPNKSDKPVVGAIKNYLATH